MASVSAIGERRQRQEDQNQSDIDALCDAFGVPRVTISSRNVLVEGDKGRDALERWRLAEAIAGLIQLFKAQHDVIAALDNELSAIKAQLGGGTKKK
jgi:hypothetical protein